jgi:hypothetical protein
MALILLAAAGVLGIVVLNWLSRATDKTSPTDVRSRIEAFLDGTSGPRDWDAFLSCLPKDPNLKRIALHCARLPEEFPPETPGHYCGAGGLRVLRQYVEELRTLEAAQGQRQ